MPIRSDGGDHRRGARIGNMSVLAFSVLCWFAATLPADPVEARPSPTAAPTSVKEKVIIDTDIGIDVDDAFAVALALCSPELDILGFTAASGDTAARVKIIDRMLGESGLQSIPVTAGPPTTSPDRSSPTTLIGLQKRYGESWPPVQTSRPSAVDFILEQIRRYPGQVTLVAIGPLSNIAAAMDKDIASFRKVKRVVVMGGWIRTLQTQLGEKADPAPEYNIRIDIPAAQKVFRSGVPLYVMPLDSTRHLALDEVRRKVIFTRANPITDSLALLYILWGHPTPVLHDAMAVAFTMNAELCPVEALHVVVDEKGITRGGSGPPNAQVCLRSDANAFLDYYVQRIVSGSQSLLYSSPGAPAMSHVSEYAAH